MANIIRHGGVGGPSGGHDEDHATRHSDGGADEVTVQNLGSAGAFTDEIPHADGAGGITMKVPPLLHAQNHAIRHVDGGPDEIDLRNLGTGSATVDQIPHANGSGGITMKTKRARGLTADFDTQNDATLSLVSGLTVALEANKHYVARYNLRVEIHDTPNMKFRITGPTGIVGTVGYHSSGSGASGDGEIGSTIVANGQGVTIIFIITITVVIENGANAGNLSFEAAQSVQANEVTKIYEGSSVELVEL